MKTPCARIPPLKLARQRHRIGKWWRVTKIPKDYIWVVFEPMPQENWSVGGILVSEKK